MLYFFAILSAIFAALTTILSKVGLKDVDPNLATAIRTIIILIMAWGIVFFTGQIEGIQNITKRSLWFLLASGVTTGLSWIFYFKALSIGDASKVAPIDKFSLVITMILAFVFLGEQLNVKTIIAGILITAGTFVLVL
ncbi:MAG: EamA family transporter [Bacillota bacterium]|nr:EamA family transporter [Bacillota bacterium]